MKGYWTVLCLCVAQVSLAQSTQFEYLTYKLAKSGDQTFVKQIRIYEETRQETATLKRAKPFSEAKQHWVLFLGEGGEFDVEYDSTHQQWQIEAEVAQSRYLLQATPTQCQIVSPVDTFTIGSITLDHGKVYMLSKQYSVNGELQFQPLFSLSSDFAQKRRLRYTREVNPLPDTEWPIAMLASLWVTLQLTAQ